jgi:DNA-binding NarL/FixJ family response regulator
VDDFQPFREWLSSKIKKADGFEVIGEAADGLEAVRMATKLVPDLILLDISLPKMDGIQSGKQLRNLVPSAQVIFVTEHSEREIVQYASEHSEGYVLKRDVERDLLPTMHAVSRGLKQAAAARQIHAGNAVSSAG